MSDDLEAHRLDRFIKSLARSSTRWVDNALLWKAFADAFPTFAGSPDQRRWFLLALQRLEARGEIELPAPRGSRWDRTFDVAVPTTVCVLRENGDAAARHWKSFPWHLRLQWVASLPRLSQEQEDLLLKVHEGLVHGKFGKRAPLKYRSLQLTGSEKRLGELASSALFGTDRLSFDLLGCYPEIPPIAIETVGQAPSLILFENADSFAVAKEVLKHMPQPAYGAVGFGGGNGLCRSLPYLGMTDRRLTKVEYVGDLDYYGLKTASAAIRLARELGLPAIQPATQLHQAMIDSARAFGHPDGWPETESLSLPPRNDLPPILDFLDITLRESIGKMVKNRYRIPEEVLGPDEMAAVWGR
jgi:hypothetical protein